MDSHAGHVLISKVVDLPCRQLVDEQAACAGFTESGWPGSNLQGAED